MASIISNSSDKEADDYTATDILLGYTSNDKPDDPFNQLGGRPGITIYPGQLGV